MFRMKVAILVLALVAVAYAAPENNEEAAIEEFVKQLMVAHKQEGAKVEDFIQNLMDQEMASEQDDGELQSSLAQNEDEEDAVIQEILARAQNPARAKAQWRVFKRIFRGVKRFVKKVAPKVLPHIPYVGHAYRAYRAYRCYRRG